MPEKEENLLESARQRSAANLAAQKEAATAAQVARDEEERRARASRIRRDQAVETATEQFWNESAPASLRQLVTEIHDEIEASEKRTLNQHLFGELRQNYQRLPQFAKNLIGVNREDVKTIRVILSTRWTVQGKTEQQIVFGPGGSVPVRHPNRTYCIEFKITFDRNKKLLSWEMGNPYGPAPKSEEEKLNQLHSFSNHVDPHYSGSIPFSEKNLEKLAEELADHLQKKHYLFEEQQRDLVRFGSKSPFLPELNIPADLG